MRILHAVHYFPPETHGGTQEYVAELAALQIADGHQVGVIAGAREHAQRARHLATCDGPPDFTYHAAYTEAASLLAEMDRL